MQDGCDLTYLFSKDKSLSAELMATLMFYWRCQGVLAIYLEIMENNEVLKQLIIKLFIIHILF